MIVSEPPFHALPPPHPCCRASIAVPARDEADRIESALAALTAQRRLDGRPLDPSVYELIVFANGCSDDTAALARAFARRFPQHAIHVIAADAGAPVSRHVGAARRAVMNAAAARMLNAGADTAVLTTDADTIVAPDWVAQNLAALRTADAVGGRIVLLPRERAALAPAVRAHLDAKTAYEFALARLENALDPLAHDPWPRHRQRCGPSLAVRAAVYARAGGVPERERLEDLGLYLALFAVDARVRHSTRVRVATSARMTARARGGFAGEVAAFADLAETGRSAYVEDPRTTAAIVAARAALRRWRRTGDVADKHAVMHAFAVSDALWHAHIAAAPTFGTAFAAAYAHAVELGVKQRRARIPIRDAIAMLAAQVRAARASASAPTRSIARSGAG